MSSPPFQMEDQTDADFFDKLVDDDFGDSVSGPSFLPGIESDDVQAFSNLTMNEVGTVSEDFGGEEEDQSKDVIVASVGAPEKDILVSEESVSLITSNSVPVESNNAVTVPSVLSESATSGGFGSKGISIKEVQWNLFNADSTQNGEGSYSEFFTGVGDSAGDPFSSYDDNLKADPFANMGNNLNADPFANLGNNVKADPFANSGNNVKADRFTDVGDKLKAGFDRTSGVTENVVSESTASSISAQHQDSQVYGASNEQTTSGQESYDTQYWENLYPGWRYDPNTGQWLQVEGFDATANAQVSYGEATQETGNDLVLGQKSEISYLQQSAQSVVETVAEGCTTGSVSTWNQAPQGITEYPAHMVFDPQYPGWYYDTITQEWRTLESYVPATQSTSTSHSQQVHSWNNSNGGFSSDEHSLYGDGQVTSYSSQNLSGQNQAGNWAGSAGNYSQQNMNMWQPETLAKSDALGSTVNRNLERIYGSRDHLENMQDQHRDFQPMGNSFMYEQASQNHSSNDVTGFQSFVPSDNSSQHFNQPMLEQSQQKHSSHDLYGSHNSTFYSPQMFQTGTQTSSKLNEGRSSAGRPPHALVTFGFGGKLIVVRDHSSYASSSAFGNQESVGGSISVLNLMDVVADKNDSTQIGLGVSDYFNTLSQQSYPGPLVGGSVGAKEVSKWIDERIAKCESPYMDYRRGQLLRLLLSLLKIASQNYGKLRSPFGTDPSLKGSDRPEIAVAELFASSSKNDAQIRGYGTSRCLQNAPSEAQQEVTATEVQNLLVYGKRLEALQCAQEGQLWGIAMQLARDLGEQFYADTEKQMAHRMLVAGSPLKTLSLLLAGQPADVFSVDNNTRSGLPGAVNMSQHHAQIGPNGMLDDWERNLAAVTSIRTKGDELVILHLGDCLWKERGENIAAHMCYLLAEANFESFSDGARLCLIGADHWKFPRTYASPEAIQRTEFYEYSMVLGNSQSVLLPFQPYKLIYAYMLAEMGRLSDSLKYCQAISKSLKTSRQPEVDVWKQLLLSLEDRIKAHQQSGFATNLAPRKLVGKFLPFIDSTIHRMMGPPPTPGPSGNANEHDGHPAIPRVANSQSTMAMQSLVPSASMEPISAWGSGGGRSMPNRSISEPDFGRSPRQEASSSDPQGKASDAGGPSRFGRFGSSFIQKTMGWVSKSRSDRQAKLGEKNKFYYDEKLKRWVEEGAEPPAEQIAPPPPPTSATFQNGMPDYNIKNAFKGDSSPANGGAEHRSPPSSERSSGIPPIPPSSNQFSARGRMGVRSRYVDTFNKGGGATTSFSAPSVAAPKPGGGAAKFFVPTPTSSSEQMADTTSESKQDNAATIQDEPTFMSKDSFLSPPPPSSSSMQRFPSMNNITPTGNKGMGSVDNGNGSLSSRSRRTASWSGSFSGAMNPPKGNEVRPLGEALGMSPLSSMQSNPSTAMHMSTNGGNFGDDLHEVEL